MKRFLAFVLLALTATTAGLRGQSLDDQYFAIFSLIQEADSLSSSERAKAVAKYLQAQTALQSLQKGSPDWNPQVVSFRLSYVAARLEALSPGVPLRAVTAVADTNKPPQTALPRPGTGETAPPAAAELQAQVNELGEQLKQMQTERALLEEKLKEALAARPAESDPRELARAEEKIKALQREIELLKVNAEDGTSAGAAADSKRAEALQRKLDEATHQLTEQKELSKRLAAEKEALVTRLKSSPDVAALQAENELLKKQIRAATTNAPAGDKPEGASAQLQEARAQIAALQSDKELLRLEKVALENRVQQLSAAPSSSGQRLPADSARVRQLERERDDLLKKLDKANQAASGRKGKSATKQLEDLQLQLATARARLEVLEARQIPYTPEELALLKQPPATLAESQAKPAARPAPSPAAAKLSADVQSFFASRQFDKAEAACNALLKEDPGNPTALANLAAIQFQAGKLDAAETSVTAALATSPEDTLSLYTLGIIKFRQNKYDESLDALSRAAKIDPQDARIQNYLGLALCEKGMRGPAESALRKAVQLQPNYAEAHYNLAVAYVSQQPPAVALGRWHYQKALALGQPRSPELERKFEAK